MGDKTGIEWTDATWNPVTGCTEVSPGCDHCYAKTFAERWRGIPGHHFEQGFDVVLRLERLEQPIRWKKPRRIFVNSMSDLFHDTIPDDYIAQVFAVMAVAEQHTFQLLTKRHGRMRSLLASPAFQASLYRAINDRPMDERVDIAGTLPLPNVWLGVSVENQQWANIRIPALLDTPAAVRFLSCEPLLGPVSLYERSSIDTGTLVDWVIVGGESGRGARPMHPGWVRHLRYECTTYGIPFLFKQWGAWAPSMGRQREQGFLWPDGRLVTHQATEFAPIAGRRSFIANTVPPEPGWTNVECVGKGAAGRELDGRTWDEFPQTVPA